MTCREGLYSCSMHHFFPAALRHSYRVSLSYRLCTRRWRDYTEVLLAEGFSYLWALVEGSGRGSPTIICQGSGRRAVISLQAPMMRLW